MFWSSSFGAIAIRLLVVVGACTATAGAELRVVALTPIVGELARIVGGEHVVVDDLMALDDNPHAFDPKPSDLKRVAEAKIVLASGKGIEVAYIRSIRDSMAADAMIFEAGRRVPSCKIDADDEVFVCCPAHSLGGLDPHWWHSPKGMKRAARDVGEFFGSIDPDHAEAYAENARTYGKELDTLHDWVRTQIASIPKSRRYLTTAHAAFGYLCRDYGLKAIPVQGLTKEKEPTPRYLAGTIKVIRKHRIPAVFAEAQANPKVLKSMVAETGVIIGGTLLADGFNENVTSYVDFMRHNVSTICTALR